LVAADIVGTVAAALDLRSIAALSLIALIRTFLSFSPEVEIKGRWPWREGQEGQRRRSPGRRRRDGEGIPARRHLRPSPRPGRLAVRCRSANARPFRDRHATAREWWVRAWPPVPRADGAAKEAASGRPSPRPPISPTRQADHHPHAPE
jgi:hypothetical protein